MKTLPFPRLNENLWKLQQSNGVIDFVIDQNHLICNGLLIGIVYQSEKPEIQKSNELMIYSVNCGACTYPYPYKTDKLLDLLKKVQVDVFCLQDCILSDVMITSLQLFNYSFAFIPNIKFGNGYSGMLVISKSGSLDNLSVFIDGMTFQHQSDSPDRSVCYIQIGFDIGNVRLYSCYMSSFSSHKQRMKFLRLFLDQTNKDNIIYVGDFNSYGLLVDSRPKNFPGWYYAAFLPQIIITSLFRINFLNIFELDKISKIAKEYNLKLFSDKLEWTYIRKVIFLSFGWVVDLVISDMRILIRLTDGIIPDDHKGLLVRILNKS